jgi:ParB family chromosome partitioning protein
MATTIKNKKNQAIVKVTVPQTASSIEQGQAAMIETKEIELSPLNYRKHFSEQDLVSFAEELKLHGIISPLTVRLLANGKYELVAGERRLRAARIAKLEIVPVMIKQLTDEQVTEIQLAENLQRENPHPMNDAQAISLMQQTGKNIEEIAARLGKSKQFVYIRLKLLNLIDEFQEMFLADVITLQQAVNVATISKEGQEDFFYDECENWKEENLELDNLNYQLRKYKYDLRNAPFDITDTDLVIIAGACTTCPFNSATLVSLFPELASQAICSSAGCYKNKCEKGLREELIKAIKSQQPVALLIDGSGELTDELLESIPEAATLERLDPDEVTIIRKPALPDKEEFDYNEEDQSDFDEQGYDEALTEYELELQDYTIKAEGGHFQKGLIREDEFFLPVLFTNEPPPRFAYHETSKPVSMKTVQESIKEGNLTAELVESAIEGMRSREERARQIDKDKIQLSIYKELEEQTQDPGYHFSLSDADQAAACLIIYQSLDYSTKSKVAHYLFPETGNEDDDSNESLYQKLKSLPESHYSYLIRMALMGKVESKNPISETGYLLYQVAQLSGIDIKVIELEQQKKAMEREKRMETNITDLKKKMKKIKVKEE